MRLRSAPAPGAGISSTNRSASGEGSTVSSAPQTTSVGFSHLVIASRTRFIGTVFGCSGSVGTSSGNASTPAFDSGVGKGGVVGFADVVGETLRRSRLDEPPDVERAAELANDVAEAQPRLARRPAAADAGVEDDEARDALGMLDRDAQPDRAAPVVHDERQIAQVELLDEPHDRVDVAVVRVPADVGSGLSERPNPIRSGATFRPGSCGMMLRQRNDDVGSPCSKSTGAPSPSST